jgi:hypothetical protein
LLTYDAVFEDKELADQAVAAVEKQLHGGDGDFEKNRTTVVEKVV